MMLIFKLHWKDGHTEIVKGANISRAFSAAGYGNGAMPALDWYEVIEAESEDKQ